MVKRRKFAITAISAAESRWVKTWAESVLKAKPDVVVVNLTQYNDDSEELFRKYIPEDKLILVKYPWQNDFSEARNHVLDHIPDDVIVEMFVDLDEVITESSYPHIEEVLRMDNLPLQIFVDIYNTVNQEGMLASLYFPRIHRLRDDNGTWLGVNYQSEVHNQLCYPPGIKQEAMRSKIAIMHYGYALDAESMAKKHKRSEALIRKQLEKDSNDAFAHLNLAQLLRAKGDMFGTEEHSRKVMELVQTKMGKGDQQATHSWLMATEQLVTSLISQKRFEEAIQIAEESLKVRPDYIDQLMSISNCYLELRDLDKAEFWLKRYLFVRSQYDETRNNFNVILNHLNSTFMALYHLGSIEAVRGNLEKARDYYERSYKAEPEFADVFIRYIDSIRRLTGRIDGGMINKHIVEHSSKAYLVYEYLGDVELERCNIENAKFNYYQAYHLSSKQIENARIVSKHKSILDAFGEVSQIFFNSSGKHQELKQRLGE